MIHNEFISVMPTEASRRNIADAVRHARKRIADREYATVDLPMPLDVVFGQPGGRTRSIVMPEGSEVRFGTNSTAPVVFYSNKVRQYGKDGPLSEVYVSCQENWLVQITIKEVDE